MMSRRQTDTGPKESEDARRKGAPADSLVDPLKDPLSVDMSRPSTAPSKLQPRPPPNNKGGGRGGGGKKRAGVFSMPSFGKQPMKATPELAPVGEVKPSASLTVPQPKSTAAALPVGKRQKRTSPTNVAESRQSRDTTRATVTAKAQQTASGMTANANSARATSQAALVTHIASMASIVGVHKAGISSQVQGLKDTLTTDAGAARVLINNTRDTEMKRLDEVVRALEERVQREGDPILNSVRERQAGVASTFQTASIGFLSEAAAIQGTVNSQYSGRHRDICDSVGDLTSGMRSEVIDQGIPSFNEAQVEVNEGFTPITEMVHDGLGELRDDLRIGGDTNRQAIEDGAAEALAIVDSEEATLLAALEAAEAQELATADGLLAAGEARYVGATDATVSAVNSAEQAGISGVEESATGFAAWLASQEGVNDDGAVVQASGQALTGLDLAGADFLVAMDTGSSSLDTDFGMSNAGLQSKLNASRIGVMSYLRGESATSKVVINGAAESYASSQTGAVDELEATFTAQVDTALASLSTTAEASLTELDSAASQAVSDLTANLDGVQGEMESECETAADQLQEEIDSRSGLDSAWSWVKNAAADIGEFFGSVEFWIGFGKAVGMLLAGVVAIALITAVCVAFGATVGAVLGVIGAIGLGLTVIVAGFMATIRYFEIYAAQGHPPNFGQVMLAGLAGIGDAIGITALIESITGENLFTGEEYSDEKRGELFFNGSFGTAMFLFSAGKAVKSSYDAYKGVDAASDAARGLNALDDLDILDDLDLLDDLDFVDDLDVVDDLDIAPSRMDDLDIYDDGGKLDLDFVDDVDVADDLDVLNNVDDAEVASMMAKLDDMDFSAQARGALAELGGSLDELDTAGIADKLDDWWNAQKVAFDKVDDIGNTLSNLKGFDKFTATFGKLFGGVKVLVKLLATGQATEAAVSDLKADIAQAEEELDVLPLN